MNALMPQMDKTDALTAPRFDIVTVVYGGELGLLRLQARSIARFVPAAHLGAILVIVNDMDEAGVMAAVEGLRAEYGPHAARLQVIAPEALMTRGPRGVFDWANRVYLRHVNGRRRARAARQTGSVLSMGWRGNNGWSMQQALKLQVARRIGGDYALLLDAKNHFVADFRLNDWIDGQGRAISARDQVMPGVGDWAGASFRVLGLGRPDPAVPLPPSVTPFVIEAGLFRDAVAALEAKLGPLETVFGLRRRNATEFMLLFAVIEAQFGGWWTRFADDTHHARAVFTKATAAELSEFLDACEGGRLAMAGVHRNLLSAPDPMLRARIEALWTRLGLMRGAADWPVARRQGG